MSREGFPNSDAGTEWMTPLEGKSKVLNVLKKREFWVGESLRYTQPHFRLEKCARIVNALSRGRSCDLLDVGCGPATLAKFLQKNIRYFGIDIAIHNAAPNLLEVDIAQNQIRFGDKTFDLVVMQGVFEYLGGLQLTKFNEIQRILKSGGKFLVTYVNFNHRYTEHWDNSSYNYIVPLESFKRDLGSCFRIDRWFPTSHNWYPSEPRKGWLKKIEMPLELNIPMISRMLGVEYFFICSSR